MELMAIESIIKKLPTMMKAFAKYQPKNKSGKAAKCTKVSTAKAASDADDKDDDKDDNN